MMRRWRRLRQRAVRLRQIGMRQRLLLAEASLRLLAARIALATAPFPRIARRLGGFVSPPEAIAKALHAPPTEQDRAIAQQVGWAVTRAARHVPFAAVCLPQAMAAHAMLRRRGISSIIHFGTMRGADLSFDAHAWLSAGPVEVTGYPVGAGFTEIACIA